MFCPRGTYVYYKLNSYIKENIIIIGHLRISGGILMKRNNVCDVTSGRAGDRSECIEVYEKIGLLMFKTRAKQEWRALLYFSVCSEKLERLLHLQVRFSWPKCARFTAR